MTLVRRFSLLAAAWLVPLFIVVMGAWRRTKWGAPPDGARAALERRKTTTH